MNVIKFTRNCTLEIIIHTCRFPFNFLYIVYILLFTIYYICLFFFLHVQYFHILHITYFLPYCYYLKFNYLMDFLKIMSCLCSLFLTNFISQSILNLILITMFLIDFYIICIIHDMHSPSHSKNVLL